MAKLSIGAKVGILVGALFLLSAAALIIAVVTLRQSVGLYWIPSVAMAPTLLPGDRIAVNKSAYLRRDPQRGDIVVLKSPPAARQNEKLFTERVIAIPGDTVRITPGYVLIGNQEFRHRELRDMLEARHSIKLIGDDVYRDGKKVDRGELAKRAGSPKAKVKVAPGVVYVNGKPLAEPYTAEDPDGAYPGGPGNMIKPEWLISQKIGKERVQLVRIPKGKLLVMGDNRNDSNDSRFWGLLDRDRVIGKVTSILSPENRAGPVH
jgi:signal peptidase I